MKKIKSCLLIIALCVAASHAGAVPWYIGGSYGLAEFDTGVTSLTGATFLDENDNGYKFYVGANATDNIALEFFSPSSSPASQIPEVAGGHRFASTLCWATNENTLTGHVDALNQC